MIIKIDDNLQGEERARLLQVLSAEYALRKFPKSRSKAAKWLGVSQRTLYTIVESNKELHKFKNKRPPQLDIYWDNLSKLSYDDRLKHDRELEQIKTKPGWRYSNKQERSNILKKHLNKFLKSYCD